LLGRETRARISSSNEKRLEMGEGLPNDQIGIVKFNKWVVTEAL
jgi:hypothetical protein